MQKLFNFIAEGVPSESGTTATQNLTAPLDTFWDSTSIVVCTAGLCIGIVWLVLCGGFAALRKSPTRRHRRGLIYWPPAILTGWILIMGLVQGLVKTEARSYPAHAVIEIALIAAMLLIAHKSFARGLRGFGLNRKKFIGDIPWAAVNLLGTLPLVLIGLWLTVSLGRLFKGTDFSLEVHQTLDTLTATGVELRILVVVFASLIVPVFEELLFRGFFQTTLRSLTNSPWAGIILTSVFFAILHPPTHIPALFMLSCGLGYAYERSGSLFRPILMHVFFNSFSVAATLLLSE